MIVLTVDEIALMLTGMGSLPDDVEEALHHVEDWIEHMRAGDIQCGRTIPDSMPGSVRVRDWAEPGKTLALTVGEVAVLLPDLGTLPSSEREGRQRIEAWVADLRNNEIPSGRTINERSG